MFSILPAFKHGLETIQKNFWIFLPLTLVFSMIDLGSNLILGNAGFSEITDYAMLSAMITPDLIWKIGLLGLVAAMANFFAVSMSLAVIRGRKPGDYIRERLDKFGLFIVLLILKACIISLGFMLFVVPGIILVFALYIAEYLYIDGKTDMTSSIRKSWDLTRGLRLGVFFFEFDVFLLTYLLSFPQMFWPDTAITYIIMILINTILLPVVWNATAFIYNFIYTAGERESL